MGLYVEGQSAPVQTVKVKVPPKATEVPVTGLKWTPTKAGETKVTLKVEPQPGELVAANNTFSTFVTVLGGGLNVLYLNGPYGAWEHKYLVHSLDASQKIQLTCRQLRQPEDPNNPSIDADFGKNAYDVYILGDLPAPVPHGRPEGAAGQAGPGGRGADHARRPGQLRRGRLGEDRGRRHPADQDLARTTARSTRPTA